MNKGYTLIELLLYVSIVGVLLVGITFFFGTITETRVKNRTISEVNEQATYAIDYIARTVRASNSISSPAVGASGNSLTVVTGDAGVDPIVFSVASGVLQVKEGSAAAVPLTSPVIQVNAFTVTNTARPGTDGMATVQLTLNRVNTSNRNEYDYAQTFTTSVGVF